MESEIPPDGSIEDADSIPLSLWKGENLFPEEFANKLYSDPFPGAFVSCSFKGFLTLPKKSQKIDIFRTFFLKPFPISLFKPL